MTFYLPSPPTAFQSFECDGNNVDALVSRDYSCVVWMFMHLWDAENELGWPYTFSHLYASQRYFDFDGVEYIHIANKLVND